MSVVIPTWCEERSLPGCLEGLAESEPPFECVVCDGGSPDGTVESAGAFPFVRCVQGPRGRGPQLNHGAREAKGEILWFLHADSRPPAGAVATIRRTLCQQPDLSLGAFRFAVDSPRRAYRIVELGVWLRSDCLRLPYGDQGYFLWRERFEELGGFPQLPALEDLRFVREVRRRGGSMRILRERLPTSARRWEDRGVVRTTLRNWAILAREALGRSNRHGGET